MDQRDDVTSDLSKKNVESRTTKDSGGKIQTKKHFTGDNSYEADAYFEAVVVLPVLSELKTGEEGDE